MNIVHRLGSDIERSFVNLFFLFYFRPGTYPRLVFSTVCPNPVKPTPKSSPRNPLSINQLEQGFDNLKFGFKQICFRSSFDHSFSSVAPIRLILFPDRISLVDFSDSILLFDIYLCISY